MLKDPEVTIHEKSRQTLTVSLMQEPHRKNIVLKQRWGLLLPETLSIMFVSLIFLSVQQTDRRNVPACCWCFHLLLVLIILLTLQLALSSRWSHTLDRLFLPSVNPSCCSETFPAVQTRDERARHHLQLRPCSEEVDGTEQKWLIKAWNSFEVAIFKSFCRTASEFSLKKQHFWPQG